MTKPQSALSQESYSRSSVLEYLLIGDLRDLLDEFPDDETRRWLLAVIEELLDLLPNEFEYEDQDGYLSDVCEQFPNWTPEVERLHAERDELYRSLLGLHRHLTEDQPFEYIASEVRPQLRRWIKRAQRHRECEQDLVLSACDLALGGEG